MAIYVGSDFYFYMKNLHVLKRKSHNIIVRFIVLVLKTTVYLKNMKITTSMNEKKNKKTGFTIYMFKQTKKN